jgi:lipopolysaccharide/colanic/teichoic acid biosynthesis glycosyltransferase
MKKNYKALLFSKIASGSVDLAGSRTSVFKTDFLPRKKSRKKRFVKPNLHKIGGMEKDVHHFVTNHVDLSDNNTVILRTRSIETINHLTNELTALVNLKKINDVRRVNKFFEEVNSHLKEGALYIGAVEVSEQRKARIFRKLPKSIANLIYTLDFILRRVLPKLNFTKGFYFFVTDGRNRVMSKAEVLGRLVACGFEIENLKSIGETLYFVAKKVRVPAYDLKPSYGPLFKMKRIGKNGKIIQVFKFRTMHPYAEYLQDYVIRTNGYQDIGKPADDFRIATWGKFLRKYWLDELPQLINVARGEMKLVGIRPVSTRFLNEFPEDIKALRLKQKPGCVPAYVSLLKQSVDGFIEAESIYLREKAKHPYTTDIKYLTKAIFNILSNKIRSA